MPIGPLESFVFPGVFTRTVNEPPLASAAGNIRFPAYIGTGIEEIRVSNFEMVRGSSSVADNIILGEDVSSQLDGTNRAFVVANFPIVKGTGRGEVANLPTEVIVQVNNEQAAVAAVNGLTGTVTLVSVPDADAQVIVNYYYKRRDTYIEEEDLSIQADGSRVTFKVKSDRIVKGDNGGTLAVTADRNDSVSILDGGIPVEVPVILVTVNGAPVSISALSGADATFTLSVAPTGGDVVLVSYFTNTHQNTFDILPAGQVSRIVRAGLSSDTTDFAGNDDYVLSNGNHINWGNAFSVETGVATVGSVPFGSNAIDGTLIDNRIYRVKAEGVTNGTNREFTLPFVHVKGDGLGTPTEDLTDLVVYVGNSPLTASEVEAISLRGTLLTLEIAPGAGNNVYVTLNHNMILDERWTFTNVVAGGDGVGKYTVVSNFRGAAKTIVAGADTATVTYPGDELVNAQIPPSKVHGNETITVTFTSTTEFEVASTGATGSGANNLGVVGQTYVDEVTGFRVTFASAATPGDVEFIVSQEHTASSSFQKSIPGIRFIVEDTTGIEVDDTGLLRTFARTGNEPNVGDIYYVTFDQVKTDYSTRFLTNMSDVTRLFGPLNINNKIVVAANLAFINGARAVALKQIKVSSTGDGSTSDYLDAIEGFNEPLENGLRPTLLQALTSNTDVISALKTSNATQSSIRYRNERTSYFGFAIGTRPEVASQIAAGVKSEKMTAVYPDGAIIALTDEFANEVEYIVGGEMIAAAMAGRDVSPVTDIATPLTGSTIVGFRRLSRRLDNVTAAQVAQSGITVLEERGGSIRIRMALTTDLSSVLTRDPRIVEVKHFVQQGVRMALDPYIGSKFLPSALGDIQKTMSAYFRALKQAQLIVDYKGIKATRNASDPSTVDVEAFYSPVLPLNWIVVTLNLRSTLS